MKVLDLKTKQTLDVNDAYGYRLIEQGKAVPAPKEQAAEKPANKKGKDGGDA